MFIKRKEAQERLNTAYSLALKCEKHLEGAQNIPSWKIFNRFSHWVKGFFLNREFKKSAHETVKTWSRFAKQENFEVTGFHQNKLQKIQMTCHAVGQDKLAQRFTHLLAMDGGLYCDFASKLPKALPSTHEIVDAMLAKTKDSSDECIQNIHIRYLHYKDRLDQGRSVTLPSYYHMTSRLNNVERILKDGQIEPTAGKNSQGMVGISDKYGAWVSNYIEAGKRFGVQGFAIGINPILHSKKVADASGNGTCKKDNPDKRYWIGVKKPIPVNSKTTSYVIVPDDLQKSKSFVNTLLSKFSLFPFVRLSEAKKEQALLHEVRPLDVYSKQWKIQ